ncbi:hypothetical protein H312_02184, partial [Anncaliia algerae PRA339]
MFACIVLLKASTYLYFNESDIKKCLSVKDLTKLHENFILSHKRLSSSDIFSGDWSDLTSNHSDYNKESYGSSVSIYNSVINSKGNELKYEKPLNRRRTLHGNFFRLEEDKKIKEILPNKDINVNDGRKDDLERNLLYSTQRLEISDCHKRLDNIDRLIKEFILEHFSDRIYQIQNKVTDVDSLSRNSCKIGEENAMTNKSQNISIKQGIRNGEERVYENTKHLRKSSIKKTRNNKNICGLELISESPADEMKINDTSDKKLQKISLKNSHDQHNERYNLNEKICKREESKSSGRRILSFLKRKIILRN